MNTVSVIIPTYNRCHYVPNAIESVLAQTYTDYEMIVVDDGSTDNTKAALRPYLDKIHYIFQPNAGVSAARNAGIRAASSELIAFLDSDDRWLPRKLELQLPLMAEENVVLSFTNWHFIDSSGNKPPKFDTSIDHIKRGESGISVTARPNGPAILLGTCIIRHSALTRSGMFDERMRIAEDSRLLYRLAFEGCFTSSAEVLYEVNVDERRPHQLTHRAGDTYRQEHASSVVEIFMEAYARASALELPEAAIIRRRLSGALVTQALCFAKAGSYSFARRKGYEAMVFGTKGRDTVRAAAGG